MSNIDILIAVTPFTTRNGLVTTDQTLVRGGLEPIGVAFNGRTLYKGIFSGGLATADPLTGALSFPNPPPPISRLNYILYSPGDGRILMQPAFNWEAPDGKDGPAFLYLAYPYGA